MHVLPIGFYDVQRAGSVQNFRNASEFCIWQVHFSPHLINNCHLRARVPQNLNFLTLNITLNQTLFTIQGSYLGSSASFDLGVVAFVIAGEHTEVEISVVGRCTGAVTTAVVGCMGVVTEIVKRCTGTEAGSVEWCTEAAAAVAVAAAWTLLFGTPHI